MDTICDKLKLKAFSNIPIFQKLAAKLKVKPEHVLLVLIVVVAVFLVFTTLGLNIISCFLGMLVPSYYSFKAIKTKEENDDKKWLTYWIVFGFFYSTKNILSHLLFFLPLFDLFLTLFLFWIYIPGYNGYIHVYNYILYPVLNSFEDRIDQFLNQAKTHIDDIKNQKKNN